MSTLSAAQREPRAITGRTVLICFLTFFGIIFAMNFVMVRVAISTFSGVETESSYKAGLSFKNDVAAAHAQDALHWDVEAKVQRDGASKIVLVARDAQQTPLQGLMADVNLAHPTDKRRDIPVQFIETTHGRFESVTMLPTGQWDLAIGLKRDGETVFRSKSRISV
jgi:nitrogen fixation protein FixH